MRDLLVAIDNAALAQDLRRVRALVAAGIEGLEQCPDAAPCVGEEGNDP
jgi:hypothetical protein